MRREKLDPDDIYCPQAALVSEEQARKTEERLKRYREKVYAERELQKKLQRLETMRREAMQRQAVLAGGAFVAAAAVVVWVWWRKKRVGKRGGSNGGVGGDGGIPKEILQKMMGKEYDNQQEQFTEKELQQCFQEAGQIVKKFPSSLLDQRDQLMLYGLYKQALEGDRNIDPPSKMNVVATAKYNAWGKFQGLPKQFAMMKYCEVVHHFANGGESVFRSGGKTGSGGGGGGGFMEDDNADVVYDEDDKNCKLDEDGCPIEQEEGREDNSSRSDPLMAGMGIRPSTLSDVANTAGTTNSIIVGEEKGSSPEVRLRNASISTDVDEMKRAMDDGANVDDVDETGQSALHFAADKGSIDCVRLLVDAGANVNAMDSDGIGVLQTAVSAAIYASGDDDDDETKKSFEVVRFLLEKGADPDACDEDGESPRSCVMEEGDEEMKELFAAFSQ